MYNKRHDVLLDPGLHNPQTLPTVGGLRLLPQTHVEIVWRERAATIAVLKASKTVLAR